MRSFGLGAIRCELLWTAVDAGGIERLWFLAVWTAMDTCGYGLEIYGSEGWGFEPLRACHRNPYCGGVSVISHRTQFTVDVPVQKLPKGNRMDSAMHSSIVTSPSEAVG